MKIPLPGLLREIRRQQFEQGITPGVIRLALEAWAMLAKRAGLYHLAMRIGIPLLSRFGRKRGRLSWVPLASGWTASRDLPAPQGQTFQQAWKSRRGGSP